MEVLDSCLLEKKGKSLQSYQKAYCVLDLETTGLHVQSTEIIEISAIKVRDGKVVEEFSTLVRPTCLIPASATAVNHITNAMVQCAPTIEEVIYDFLDFIQEDVLVGYNIASFDLPILRREIVRITKTSFINDYIDLLFAIRRSLHLENSKLETVSKYYQLDTTGEHRALKDCYLTHYCYEKVYEEFGNAAFKRKSTSFHVKKSQEAKLLEVLQELLEDILFDGVITRCECLTLQEWIEEHDSLRYTYPFDRIYEELEKILRKRWIRKGDVLHVKEILSLCDDPIKSLCSHCKIETLAKKHICLTGDFSYGSKEDVYEMILCAGGIVDKHITKSTHYVIVGAKRSTAWKEGKFGSKIKKAIEYNETYGQGIQIVEEEDFIPYLIQCIKGNR